MASRFLKRAFSTLTSPLDLLEQALSKRPSKTRRVGTRAITKYRYKQPRAARASPPASTISRSKVPRSLPSDTVIQVKCEHEEQFNFSVSNARRISLTPNTYIGDWANYEALYNEFRVVKCVTVFQPLYDGPSQMYFTNGGIRNELGLPYFRCSHVEDPTGAETTASILDAYERDAVVRDARKRMSITWTPNAAVANGITAPSPWLNTATHGGTAHYGVNMYFEYPVGYVAPAQTVQTYIITHHLQVQFKN